MITFKVDVARFIEDRERCGDCMKCYVEQLWRDIGRDENNHCSKTCAAFFKACGRRKKELPNKDEYVILNLKSGKHVLAKLLYDDEDKPCMYCDDLDNWYSMQEIESVYPSFVNGCITIAVNDD